MREDGWNDAIGTIGAGKSSLTDMLSQEMNSKPFYENVDDNEVLPLFYWIRKIYISANILFK